MTDSTAHRGPYGRRMTRDTRYLPIADHGVIGDLRTAALVGTDATIAWFCCPRFDSPSVSGALLGSENGGQYRISPVEACSTKQLYFPETNVLVTRFLSPAGVAEVQDFMPVGGEQRLVRRVVCIRGELRLRLDCQPRFNYARDEHETAFSEHGALFRSPELTLALTAPIPLSESGAGARAEFVLAAGETGTFVLEAADGGEVPAPIGEERSTELFEETVTYWRDWVSQSRYRGRWREQVNRAALALKLLTSEPTGAIVAAVTTSLPEQLGGERNWDYRYTWVRDAAFTLSALQHLGFTSEAEGFGRFLLGCFDRGTTNGSG